MEIAPPAVLASNIPTQCTVMVQPQVRQRFGHYQTAVKVETGIEPTNAVVVKRAFLQAHKSGSWAELRDAVRHRQQPVSAEDDDPAGLFGEVPARRVELLRKRDVLVIDVSHRRGRGGISADRIPERKVDPRHDPPRSNSDCRQIGKWLDAVNRRTVRLTA